MIKHIVFWNFKDEHDGMNKEDIKMKVQQMLEALPLEISEIIEFEVGQDFNRSEKAFDTVLYSSFKNKEDLQAYQEHSSHQLVKDFIGSVTVERAVVDYEV